MLDLDARIHLDEDVLRPLAPLGLDQELNRAGAGVVDRLGESHRIAAQRLAQLARDVRSRRDLHDLLVTPLHRAVTLEEMDRVALGVGEDLHLNMPRAADSLLDEGSWVAEGALGFAHGSRNRIL